MRYEQIIALLGALAGGEPDTTSFEKVVAGGYDPATPITVAPCLHQIDPLEIEGQTIICGSVSVPENHANPDGRRIDLPFVVLKSRSTYPAADPVVYLHGGPGGGTLYLLKLVTKIFDPFRETRDVITFNQRAAGQQTTAVDCLDVVTANIVEIAQENIEQLVQTAEGAVLAPALVSCITEFKESGAKVEDYNTVQNAYDVRAIMKTFGYDTYNIYGISYGTKLALEVMRSAPEGVRAVIIDGVAPASVRLYDTLAVPLDQAINILIEECAADVACNTAYPNLGGVLREVLDKAAKGEVVVDGTPLPPHVVLLPIVKRNGQHGLPSLTPYLPAMIYEFHRGGDMPTVAMLFDKELTLVNPGPEEVRAAAAELSDEEKRIIDIVLAEAAALRSAGTGIGLAVDELKEMLRRDRELGPLPALLEQEMSKYVRLTVRDPEKARAMLVDYAGLQKVEPSKEALKGFIERNFEGEGQARLLALIEAMTGQEVQVAFMLIRSEVAKHTHEFTGSLHLWIYACQEDVPYNTPEGFEAQNAELDWPESALFYLPTAAQFYLACEHFEHYPRPEFFEPVVSDIPTLSIGSTWDIQTAPYWPAVAAETLSNAQTFLIPEAGHGALAYQPCVGDMGVAFLNDPGRKLDNSCVESSKPKFYIAPWVNEGN